MSTIQAGYPIRRQGNCGQYTGSETWDDFWNCCPRGTSGPADYGDNTQCPDSDTGAVPAQCANSTWTLWWNKGYFCCEPALMGFTNGFGWYGCGTKTLIQSNDTWVQATPTGTCLSSPTSTASFTGSSSDTGAIVGAAVGGFLVHFSSWE
ncbi:hypothetical protein N7457_002500 [Penicillium paradoxum]|uniref:uncharacterized protein n=1 Tax=Penicillium paradoxum TaxID=176176 RepID=UPI002547BF15|nr:uncharacterized protein N7457_002500 [Penicillium paradoxum]KAJ5787510.1 hypothetical protein N7457_002500 [Penicillium paradoxum]